MTATQSATIHNFVRTVLAWKWLLSFAVFFIILLASLPSFAIIHVNQENPGNGATGSGITAVSGWTYSSIGADVAVRLRLDGETRDEIPCCGPRQDVQNENSEASLEAGFGFLFNYALLPPGVHTIGVEVSAPGEETVVVDHAVNVVVPGNQEFLQTFDLSGATASVEDNTIVVTGVEVGADDDTSTTTVDLTYDVGLQSFIISTAQGEAGPPMSPFDATQLLSDVANNVTLSTYEDLDDLALTLLNAVTTFTGDLTQANLHAAQAAWREARVPWEQSEAFLFGPVSDDGRDPKIDTWPVNVVDISAVVEGPNPVAITTATIDSLDDTAKGFHTIEYLLFGDGTQTASEIVTTFQSEARRGEYLLAAVESFENETAGLEESWAPSSGNFVDELGLAGQGSTTFTSQHTALQELVNGMIGIAGEVANEKIAVPLDEGTNTNEESRFSNNSRIDFANNIRSVHNIYTGRFDQNMSGTVGVGAFVADQDPALDAEIRAAILTALTAILAIPEPFGESIISHAASVQAAVDAVTALQGSLEKILPLIDGASFSF